ncbi:UDP-N-acetylmuramoyl-L-alanine--D-glutamate ligase [Saccharicrinis aurantiacus]|uniref:UDP-N-acetylmuramoyl-L-alanine--D-glutamate ligase n=1 Tax=Saccharicrinis aurantiacus TaxID=1849719 RepID=UPI00094F74A6|nr:UDP-N-acetylmuramoyl-L-alanine--D-glutamate ligase [Saccharicrinis aurantiacus]
MGVDVVILGAGESGVGAALLAQKLQLSVFVSDLSEIKSNYKAELDEASIAYEEKKHSQDIILSAKTVVKSPGIPDTAPLIVELTKKGIPVISEIEFAVKYTSSKFICITGSNGKTTTTLLIHNLLKNAGINVGLAGNIGQSLARQVALGNKVDWYVLELSSFQLDGMYRFKADVAVLLNITPDHLDRYNYEMKNYVDSKFRIIQNQTDKDYFIYCSDDETITQKLEEIECKPQKLAFSANQLEGDGGVYKNDTLIAQLNGKALEIPFEGLQIKGVHNAYNALAASLVSLILELKNQDIQDGLCSFSAVEHRLEEVRIVNKVVFINDSKATNVDSAWYALESINTPIIWIAGGVDKGNDYSQLKHLASEKIKALVCLGTNNEKLTSGFKDFIETIVETDNIEEAVKLASDLAVENETVLLSPACASFDLFTSYEQRGNLFKEYVRKL